MLLLLYLIDDCMLIPYMLCRIYFGSTKREIRCGLSRVRVTGSCHFPGAPTRRRIPRASKRWLAFVLQSSNAISIVKQISSSFTPLEIKIETPPMPTEFQSQEPPPCLRNSSLMNPPCLRNSKMPPVVRYGYFLESPNIVLIKGAASSIFSVTMNSPKTYLFQWNR